LGSDSDNLHVIRENVTKTNVQEFLTSELFLFLKDYEELVRSNSFSYTQIWNLKQGYLDLLYKDVKKALRDEKPYAMYREGESWKIVFDGEPFGSLNGVGFRWIYYILSTPDVPVKYRDLDEIIKAEKNVEQTETDEMQGDLTITSTGDQYDKTADFTKKVEDDWRSAIKKLIEDRAEAKSENDTKKLKEINKKRAESEEFIRKEYNRKVVEKGTEIKFEKIDLKPHTQEHFTTINNRIKRNFNYAMGIIKKRDDKLYAHLNERIILADGAFTYYSSPDIDWHII
jgi:hypothetical protein